MVYGETSSRELAPGWRIGSISILADRIEVTLNGPSDTPTVVFALGEAQSPGAVLGRTRSFTVWLEEPSSEESRHVARNLFADVDNRDDGRMLRLVQPSASGSVRKASPGQTNVDALFRAFRWGALLVFLAIGLKQAIAARGLPSATVWIALFGLFGVALALRLWVPAWAPLHANSHGIDEIRGLAGHPHVYGAFTEVDLYSTAWRQWIRALIAPFGGQTSAVLAATATLGALSVIALGLAARVAFDSWAVAGLAGIAVALHPSHVVLSLSESPWVGAMLLWSVAVTTGAMALSENTNRRTPWIWATALSLAAAAELRMFTLALPASALIVLAGVSGWRRLTRSDVFHVAAGTVVVAVVSMFHLRALLPMIEVGPQRLAGFNTPLALFFSPNNILAHAELAPLGLVVLAGLAFVLMLVFRELRKAGALLSAYAVLAIPGFTVIACRTDMIRYQTPVQFVLILMVATGVEALCRRIEAPFQKAAWVFVVSVVGLTSWPGLTAASRRSFDERSFELVADIHDALPRKLVVFVPPHKMGDGRVWSDFPAYLLRERGVDVEVREISAESSRSAKRPEVCYAYIAPDCYEFTEEEIAAGEPGKRFSFAGERVRRDCEPLARLISPDAVHATETATIVDVPWRDRLFHRVVAERALVGLFACGSDEF